MAAINYAVVRRFVIRICTQLAALLTSRGSYPLIKALLALTWLLVLWWGERGSFDSKTRSCHWDQWENWPAGARPHHVVLLADPQLVDPHTYPGRPWPLNSLTIAHTDQYLRRGYSALQQNLDPDSVIFLGDLFDGGREWWTGKGQQPKDQTWKNWGGDFWLKEYDRWGKIFLQNNGRSARTGNHVRGDRKMIASLPGNHDLGIADGVRLDVRDRFSMFFGDVNRVDVLGNHSFVSVDTVSLSAKYLETSQAVEENKGVWEPANDFLNNAQRNKALALQRYLNAKEGLPENPQLAHQVLDLQTSDSISIKTHAGEGISSNMPTILLTHVPLYRNEGMPCGPLREKYPPSKASSSAQGSVKDLRNAISLHKGYQYQNVLQPELSRALIEKAGNVAHVFSGDDHDYCEVVHSGYTSNGGGVREITVKSMSWAMGVRRPGFLLVSLWNPIDEKGQTVGSSASGGSTIQTRLCLLPDALGTFIRYGEFFAFTAVVLLIIAIRDDGSSVSSTKDYTALLPLVRKRPEGVASYDSSASSSISDAGAFGLSARGGRKTGSPSNGWAIPMAKTESQSSDSVGSRSILAQKGKKTRREVIFHAFASGLLQVGIVGFSWYLWLARNY